MSISYNRVDAYFIFAKSCEKLLCLQSNLIELLPELYTVSVYMYSLLLRAAIAIPCENTKCYYVVPFCSGYSKCTVKGSASM